MVIYLYFLLENIITDRLILFYMEINTLLPQSDKGPALSVLRNDLLFFALEK